MKMRFVMLLIDSWNCKIEKNEKVEKSYLIVKRDKREKIFDFFDFETIFVHDIDIFDVVNKVTNDVIDDTDVENAKKMRQTK